MKRLSKHTPLIILVFIFMLGLLLGKPESDTSLLLERPSFAHFLGTTPSGFDVFHSCLYGASLSLLYSLSTMAITCLCGMTIGWMASLKPGGLFDHIQAMMVRLTDSIGPVFLGALFLTMLPSGSMLSFIVFLGLITWGTVATQVRATSVRLSNSSLVEAARSIGCSEFRIFRVYTLPEIIETTTPLLFLLLMSYVVLFGALGFLGIGARNAQDLGAMLDRSRVHLSSQPYFFLGIVLTFTLLIGSLAATAQTLKSHFQSSH